MTGTLHTYRSTPTRLPIWLVAATVLLQVLTGCATPSERHHAEFDDRLSAIKTLYLMPPDVMIFETLAPRQYVLRQDWSQTGQEILAQALTDVLADKHYRVIFTPSFTSETRIETQEIQTLYQAVNKSIQLHSYGSQKLATKNGLFDYSIGKIDSYLERHAAGGLLFVRALNRVAIDNSKTYISIGIADRTGTIVWYSARGTQQNLSLMQASQTKTFVKDILTAFPEAES